jgi:predicted metal-dependent peptidase
MIAIKKTLTAEQRIELVHVSLMRNKKFALFSGLFMVGKTTVDDETTTAATNGRDARYGRAFIDQLTDKELAFLIMHENMHKCYRHLTTWRSLHDIDHRLANAACDYVINIQLVDMDSTEECLAFPTDKRTGRRIGLCEARFRGMDAKQVFDILMQERKERGERGDDDSEAGNDGSDDEGSVITGDGGKNPDGQGNSMDDHDWDGAKELSDQEQKDLERDIEQALRQGGIYAGKVGANIPREIGELLQPKVDWREVLRRFIRVSLKDRDSASWRKAHKNYLWQDIILPSILGKRMKHLVIAMDTSGSIFGDLLTAFLSELNKIVKDVGADRIDILYWDTAVANHETYKGVTQDIVHRTNPAGGGGTNPNCVVEYMKEHKLMEADALVMLSDGYMDSNKQAWAAMTKPTLWCIIGNDSYTPPCGQKLVIKE